LKKDRAAPAEISPTFSFDGAQDTLYQRGIMRRSPFEKGGEQGDLNSTSTAATVWTSATNFRDTTL
jgi:hypothetical protein